MVSSSGSLHGFQLGPEVDSHETVIRFNSDPTQGFQLAVGNRTTLRLTNAQHWGFFEHFSETVLVPLHNRVAMEALIRVRTRFGRLKFASLNPDFLQYLTQSFSFVPSVRLMGVILALHRCSKVSLYGFHVCTLSLVY